MVIVVLGWMPYIEVQYVLACRAALILAMTSHLGLKMLDWAGRKWRDPTNSNENAKMKQGHGPPNTPKPNGHVDQDTRSREGVRMRREDTKFSLLRTPPMRSPVRKLTAVPLEEAPESFPSREDTMSRPTSRDPYGTSSPGPKALMDTRPGSYGSRERLQETRSPSATAPRSDVLHLGLRLGVVTRVCSLADWLDGQRPQARQNWPGVLLSETLVLSMAERLRVWLHSTLLRPLLADIAALEAFLASDVRLTSWSLFSSEWRAMAQGDVTVRLCQEGRPIEGSIQIRGPDGAFDVWREDVLIAERLLPAVLVRPGSSDVAVLGAFGAVPSSSSSSNVATMEAARTVLRKRLELERFLSVPRPSSWSDAEVEAGRHKQAVYGQLQRLAGMAGQVKDAVSQSSGLDEAALWMHLLAVFLDLNLAVTGVAHSGGLGWPSSSPSSSASVSSGHSHLTRAADSNPFLVASSAAVPAVSVAPRAHDVLKCSLYGQLSFLFSGYIYFRAIGNVLLDEPGLVHPRMKLLLLSDSTTPSRLVLILDDLLFDIGGPSLSSSLAVSSSTSTSTLSSPSSSSVASSAGRLMGGAVASSTLASRLFVPLVLWLVFLRDNYSCTLNGHLDLRSKKFNHLFDSLFSPAPSSSTTSIVPSITVPRI